MGSGGLDVRASVGGDVEGGHRVRVDVHAPREVTLLAVGGKPHELSDVQGFPEEAGVRGDDPLFRGIAGEELRNDLATVVQPGQERDLASTDLLPGAPTDLLRNHQVPPRHQRTGQPCGIEIRCLCRSPLPEGVQVVLLHHETLLVLFEEEPDRYKESEAAMVGSSSLPRPMSEGRSPAWSRYRRNFRSVEARRRSC